MALENLTELENEWAQFMLDKTGPRGGWTQDQRWRDDNPGALQQLLAYRNSGGTRPTLPLGTGARMVFHVDAYLKAKGADAPPPPPPPPPDGFGHREGPRGTLTKKTGAVWLRDGDGALTEKIHITSSPDYGISNMRWPYVGASTGLWTLRDCKVENVSASPPRAMDGTGESGFWVGEKTLAERLETRGAAWMGLWTGAACKGSRFYDCNFQSELIPYYPEHITEDVEFHYCTFGGEQNEHSSSINAEWWYADSVYGAHLPYGGKAGSFNVKFYNCEIYCPLPPPDAGWRAYQTAGAFLDGGTFGFRFENCRFWGPGNAVGMPNKMVDPSKPNVVIGCTFDNDGKEVYFHDNLIG